MRTAVVLALVATFVAVEPPGPAAAAADALRVSAVERDGQELVVTGELVLGEQATADLEVGIDGTGDTAPGAGFDVTRLGIAADAATRRLTFSMDVFDGFEPTDGAPFVGYVWPLSVDGDGAPWLTAGNEGSNYPPRQEKWTAVCHPAPSGSATCEDLTGGAVGARRVTWQVPLDAIGARFGTTLTAGSTSMASAAGSVTWAVVTWTGWPVQDEVAFDGYRIPGGISAALVAHGTTPAEQDYRDVAVFDPHTGAFQGRLPTPDPGRYTLHVRSCYGSLLDLLCVDARRDLTI